MIRAIILSRAALRAAHALASASADAISSAA